MQAWIYENEMDYLEIEFLEEDEPDPQGIREYGKRAEWADKYAPGPLSAQQWMENGYTYSCAYCEHQLSLSDGYCDDCAGENDEDDLCEENAGIVFDGDSVYCGAGCQRMDREEFERRKAAREKCKADFLEQFPFATVTDVWNGSIPKCKCFHENHYNACLHWTIPGGMPGGFTNTFCGGCKKAWVCNGDLEAFNKAKCG